MLLRYLIAMAVTVLAIFFAVILGDYGPWYFSWVLGTGFMILVAVSAGVLFEAQDDAAKAAAAPTRRETEDLARVVAGPAPVRPTGGTTR